MGMLVLMTAGSPLSVILIRLLLLGRRPRAEHLNKESGAEAEAGIEPADRTILGRHPATDAEPIDMTIQTVIASPVQTATIEPQGRGAVPVDAMRTSNSTWKCRIKGLFIHFLYDTEG